MSLTSLIEIAKVQSAQGDLGEGYLLVENERTVPVKLAFHGDNIAYEKRPRDAGCKVSVIGAKFYANHEREYHVEAWSGYQTLVADNEYNQDDRTNWPTVLHAHIKLIDGPVFTADVDEHGRETAAFKGTYVTYKGSGDYREQYVTTVVLLVPVNNRFQNMLYPKDGTTNPVLRVGVTVDVVLGAQPKINDGKPDAIWEVQDVQLLPRAGPFANSRTGGSNTTTITGETHMSPPTKRPRAPLATISTASLFTTLNSYRDHTAAPAPGTTTTGTHPPPSATGTTPGPSSNASQTGKAGASAPAATGSRRRRTGGDATNNPDAMHTDEN